MPHTYLQVQGSYEVQPCFGSTGRKHARASACTSLENPSNEEHGNSVQSTPMLLKHGKEAHPCFCQYTLQESYSSRQELIPRPRASNDG